MSLVTSLVYCYRCGEQNPANAEMCKHCGRSLNRREAGSRPIPVSGIRAATPHGMWLVAGAAFVLLFVVFLITLSSLEAGKADLLLFINETTLPTLLGQGAGAPAGTSLPENTESPPRPTETAAEAFLGGGRGQIAFASDRGGRPQIWLYFMDGHQVGQLTDLEGGACQPEWSPDGMALAFISPCVRNEASYSVSAIFSLAVDTGQIRRLTAGVGGDYNPTWSPDGATLAFTSRGENDIPQIYFYDVAEERESRFPLGDASFYQADWSPDGSQLLFLSNALGAELMFTASVEHKKLVQFLSIEVMAGKFLSSPAWASNGEVVLYTLTPRSGGFSQIYASRLADNGQTKYLLLSEANPGREPAVSPDGNWVAFESWPDAGNHDIWIATMEGLEITRLTADAANDFDPAWRP